MSQGNISISNGSGASVRAAMNAALARLQSQGSGNGRPADITTYEIWVETDNPGFGVVSFWLWDGSQDVLVGIFDTTAHKWTGAGDFLGSVATADAYRNSSSSVVFLTTTTETLQPAHNGKVVSLTNAGATTLTVPSTLPAGFSCVLVQGGGGQVAVVAGSGATVQSRNGLKLGGPWAAAGLTWLAGAVWLLAGDVTT